LVDGKIIFSVSRFTATLSPLAKALKIASILCGAHCPSALMLMFAFV
jgi:hypothetical protein